MPPLKKGDKLLESFLVGQKLTNAEVAITVREQLGIGRSLV